MNDLIMHIATAATQQSIATQQVTSNMEQIAGLVQEASVGAEQSAKACSDLSDLALDLQRVVGRFKLGDSPRKSAQLRSAVRGAALLPLEMDGPRAPGLPSRSNLTVQ